MTHTPGPWRWFDYPDGRKLLSGQNRAVIHCPDAPMTCGPADARLIAAAPELLAALKEVVAEVERRRLSLPFDPIAHAKGVIAKAEGLAEGVTP
jgi:hypothetical protein